MCEKKFKIFFLNETFGRRKKTFEFKTFKKIGQYGYFA